MAIVSACPDVAVLQQLAMGRMPPHEVEHLAKHCEQCPRCIQVLHTMKLDDTLIEAMAAQSTAPHRACTDAVHSLIERLKQMPSPVPAPELSATIGAESTPPASIETTQAGDIALAPPQAADEIGRLGGYRILKMLGAGGMGMVYQAEDVHLQRPIALKVMKAEVAKNPGNRERFLREARAAAKLKSDHVVTIHQVGEDNQVVFLAMEYLEGMSLDDWMKKGRIPSLAQTVRIGRQIALGLADAHACGLIHRDIKPGNIWLDNRHQGRVKLLDFGLARGTTEEVQLTQSGAIVGTPAYMAPEQARSDKVDHRVDLFSLGVVLYRLTTGQLPFRGDNTMSILTALALDTPKPPREINADISPRLAELIERLLSKDREQRPATAKAVADELASIEREASQTLVGAASVSAPVVGAASVSAPVVPTVSLRSPIVPRLRYGLRKYVVAASLLLLLGGLAAAIVIIVRDPQGNKIAEVEVPKGSKVEIKDEEAKANVPPREEAKIAVPPLAPMQPGEPLSPSALVQQPAKLPGVRSWSIEKRDAPSAQIAAFRPDGKRLAVGNYDGSVRIWEPQTGRLVQVLLGQGDVRSLAWSPDGRILAVGAWELDQPIRLSEAETGRPLRTLAWPNSSDRWSQLAWSPDGRKVLASRYKEWVILDAVDGKMLHRFPLGHGQAGAFSPDGKFVAGWEDSRSGVVIWDAETGKEVRKLIGVGKGAGWPNWSPAGKHLGYGGSNGTFVWEASTGKQIVHCQDVKSPSTVIWSPDGRMWASFGGDAARLLELGAKEQGQVQVYSGPFSPDGKFVVGFMVRIGDVHLYDPATGKRLRTLSEGTPNLHDFAWSAAGPSVAARDALGTLVLSSVDTGQVFARLNEAAGPLAWSPDGKRLATAGRKGAVILWEDNGKTRIALNGHQQDISWLAWSPDGKRLASSSDHEKGIFLWDTQKGERLRELGPFEAAAKSLSWSADGRLLAFNVGKVGWHIWDVEQNKLANDPKQWKVEPFVFRPDLRSAIVFVPGKGLRLRELATGKELRHHPVGNWGASSPDGSLVALIDHQAVELWRGDLSRRVRTLKVTQDVRQADFTADGKLVAGRSDNRLYLWETDTGRLRGILILGEKNNGFTIAPDGQYTGNDQVDRGIVVVVQKDDGTQELLEPADFEQKYGWKNEPDKVHLLQPLPPLLTVPEGQPMGPLALVREPMELPDANSWTIETVNPRGSDKAVAYRPDGKLLATGGDDGTIRLWDTSSGKLVRMLVGDHPVRSLSWSKDGKVLTAGNPKAGREWDVDVGRLLRLIAGIANPAVKEARSPDGKQTAKIEPKGVYLYDADGKRTHTLEESPGEQPIVWLDDANGFSLGVRLPFDAYGQLAVTADGHYRGNARVERAIRMVVQKRDGSSETLTPLEFERKYGFKNEPDKVRLTDK